MSPADCKSAVLVAVEVQLLPLALTQQGDTMKVEITWEDAVIEDGISQEALYENRLTPTRTVKTTGYLIGENERVVNVALSKRPTDRKYTDVLSIPRGSVLNIEEL